MTLRSPEAPHRGPGIFWGILFSCTFVLLLSVMWSLNYTCPDSLKSILLFSPRPESPHPQHPPHLSPCFQTAPPNCFYCVYIVFLKNHNLIIKVRFLHPLLQSQMSPHSPLTLVHDPLNSFLPLASMLCRYNSVFVEHTFPNFSA